MSEKLLIEVTLNLERCLDVLKEAIQELPSGDQKDRAEGALDYIARTFKGEPQPMEGRACPPGIRFIPG